jgi:hypothetical protein
MMKRYRVWIMLALVLLLVPSMLEAGVLTQSGEYTVGWFTLGSGGQASGGAFTLDGVIGQADAGALSGGAYTLRSGFAQVANHRVYLPVILR